MGDGDLQHRVRPGHLHGERVKKCGRSQFVADALQAGGQHAGKLVHALGDALQALRAVVDGIHAGHHSGQYLRGADVAGGFFAADVLLACLQRQPVRRVAVRVHTHAHQAAGHGAFVRVQAGHVGGVRAAVAHGAAKALRAADADVGPQFAGGREHGQRQQVSGHDDRLAFGFDRCNQRPVVAQHAAGAGVLQQHGKAILGSDLVSCTNHHFNV